MKTHNPKIHACNAMKVLPASQASPQEKWKGEKDVFRHERAPVPCRKWYGSHFWHSSFSTHGSPASNDWGTLPKLSCSELSAWWKVYVNGSFILNIGVYLAFLQFISFSWQAPFCQTIPCREKSYTFYKNKQYIQPISSSVTNMWPLSFFHLFMCFSFFFFICFG